MQRIVYTNKKRDELEQGAVFCGGISENYKGNELYGIIITPRCDISNNKVHFFNYLPVIPYQDWIINDFWNVFQEQLLCSLIDNLKRSLSNKGVSESVVDRFSIHKIKEVFISKYSKKGEITKFETLLSNIKEVQSDIDSLDEKYQILEKYEKLAKGILKDIVNNRNPNFHIIESWEDDNKYYIILLREIKKITYDIGMNLYKGIESCGLQKEDFKLNDLNPRTKLYYIEKTLSSPYIEHLIQRFTGNFNKIGVQDHFSKLTDFLFDNAKK